MKQFRMFRHLRADTDPDSLTIDEPLRLCGSAACQNLNYVPSTLSNNSEMSLAGAPVIHFSFESSSRFQS